MHEAFESMTPQADLEMRRLGEGLSSFAKVNLPPFRRSLFAKLSMDDITFVKVNEYCQPLVRVRSKLRALRNDPSLPLYLVFMSGVEG